MSAGFAIRPQAFEAEAFGAPVWRLEVEDAGAVTARNLRHAIGRARDEGVALISVRVPVGAAVEALVSAGFRPIEKLMSFKRAVATKAERIASVTLAQSIDAEACADIARTSFVYDRFHADGKLPNAIADEIKARWARNGVNGRADAPLVVREGGVIAGFNLCMRKGADAVIDLIAVGKRWQGRGLGRVLVAGALAHYAGVAPTMWVSTQESNVASIALYRGAGFAFHSAAQTWHWTP